MDNKNLGNKIGQAMFTILAACVMAIIIALTAKLIIWIF